MIMKNIRCNNNGCNCTKEEKATNNGNCKHSVIVYTTNSIAQAVEEERERVRGEIEKYMSYCVELQNKAIANGNTITVETWGNRWVGAKEILSSLDKSLIDKDI